MTVIAWDKKILAADSQATANGSRRSLGNVQKIHVASPSDTWTIEGKKIQAFGFAGRFSASFLIKSLLSKGIKHDTEIDAKDLRFTMLAVGEAGDVFLLVVSNDSKKNEKMTDLTPVTGPIAIGTGGVFAEAVMAIGMSSVDAVKAAIKLDVMSGGEVAYWEAWKGNLSTAVFIEQNPHPLNALYLELVETLNQPIGSDEDVKLQIAKMQSIIAKPEYESLH